MRIADELRTGASAPSVLEPMSTSPRLWACETKDTSMLDRGKQQFFARQPSVSCDKFRMADVGLGASLMALGVLLSVFAN